MDNAVLDFAEYLGLDGVDADLFYESYYDLNSDEYDYENLIEEHYASYSWEISVQVHRERCTRERNTRLSYSKVQHEYETILWYVLAG